MTYDPGSYSYGGPGSDTEAGVSQFDQGSADVPIWGWLSGASARRDAQRAQAAASANRGYWNNLHAPSESDLMGPDEDRSAQMQALQRMQGWQSGGLTSTDRSTLEATRARDAQAAGAAARGISQQAQARGVGGSGLDYAAQLSAQQQGQQQASDAESAAMQGAQQRGLAATQASGQMAGQLRSQDVGATQQAYEDAARRAAGATGQYGGDQSAQLQRQQMGVQRDQSLAGIAAALVS